MSIRERWAVVRQKRRWREETITFDAGGVSVRWNTANSKSGRHQLAWSTVASAIAFKRDLLVVDKICIKLRGQDTSLVVHEEMDGWEAFLAALPQHLKGCMPRDEIYERVMLPAFEANETEIFRAG